MIPSKKKRAFSLRESRLYSAKKANNYFRDKMQNLMQTIQWSGINFLYKIILPTSYKCHSSIWDALSKQCNYKDIFFSYI
jgi:hypothetical protein